FSFFFFLFFSFLPPSSLSFSCSSSKGIRASVQSPFSLVFSSLSRSVSFLLRLSLLWFSPSVKEASPPSITARPIAATPSLLSSDRGSIERFMEQW
ncbi:unnamed protein product, partial [Brassica rapa subsp. narinosa]